VVLICFDFEFYPRVPRWYRWSSALYRPRMNLFSGPKKINRPHPNRPKLTGLPFPTLHNGATRTAHMVASKCSSNNFISDQYKTVQSFRLHLLQNNFFVRQYTYASDCKGVGNIHGSYFLKAFSALPLHS